MQLFVTSSCPVDSALRLWKNPNRARKMITEYQQMLACAMGSLGYGQKLLTKDGEPYKTPLSRMNHPCIKWMRESKINTAWCYRSLEALYAEYVGDGFTNVIDNLITIETTDLVDQPEPEEFFNFAKADDKGLDFRHIPCVFTAYDKFLKAQGS